MRLTLGVMCKRDVMNKVLTIKIILSILFISLTAVGLFIVWSPLLVTYVPPDPFVMGICDSDTLVADLNKATSNLRTRFWSALEVSSVLWLVILLLSLVVIWFAKFGRSNENT